MNILFVCTGNTCRSSIAEGIFKKMLKDIKKHNIEVSSSGISAFEGEHANEKAINILKNKGIDISTHRASQLNDSIIKNADLILTMTTSHKIILKGYAPNFSSKIFTLKEYGHIINDEEVNGDNLDIADPYGLDYNVYELCIREIEKELKKILNNISKIN